MKRLSTIVVIVVTLSTLCAAQQYKSVAELPNDVYRLKLDGLVTAVHEGDNFIFYHIPGNSPNVGRVNYKDTIIVRLVGINAPEISRPGVPGEPFSQLARNSLARDILNKRITVELFAKNGFDEVWGSVNSYGENLSVKQVQQGLARVLIDRTAVYGDVRSQLFKAETRAKLEKLGIWSI